jgi:hypothetical protein
MSKGLGRTQVAILIAMASKPSKQEEWPYRYLEPPPPHEELWLRVELQQAVWGKHPNHLDEGGYFKRSYGPVSTWGQRTAYAKNIAPFSGTHRNYEQNFSRALASLKARGLIKSNGGFYTEVRLTEAGRKEAERYTQDGGIVAQEELMAENE